MDALLKEGIAAAQTGQTELARSCLLRAIEIEEQNLSAWYWLSRVVESIEEREVCLENVLALDPGHTAVRAELAALRRKKAEAEAASLLSREAVAASIPLTADEHLVSEAAVEPLPCPFCGAETGASDQQCPACGYDLYVRERKRKGHSIYSMGLVIAWFALANYIWLGLTSYYLFSGFSSALDASPGAARTLETLGILMGIEGSSAPLLDLPLTPVLLAGGAAFLLSLVIAWGLYRRLRFFYWLTVSIILLVPFVTIYQIAAAETVSVWAVVIRGFLFLTTISFAFMAYDEFTWVERRLAAVLDRDVDSHSALYARGRKHAEEGMWARAAIHWAKAVALSPGHPDYRLALASAYINLGQPGRAMEHLEVARHIEPHNAQVDALLAQASAAR